MRTGCLMFETRSTLPTLYNNGQSTFDTGRTIKNDLQTNINFLTKRCASQSKMSCLEWIMASLGLILCMWVALAFFQRLQFPVASSHIYHHEYPAVRLVIGGTISLNYNVVLHWHTILMSTHLLFYNVWIWILSSSFNKISIIYYDNGIQKKLNLITWKMRMK